MSSQDDQEFKKLIDICHSNLMKTAVGKEYLFDNRMISEDAYSKYQIGYFPRNIKKLTNYVSEEFLKKQGLMDFDGSSQFSDYYSIVFPLFDEYGSPVGLSGRTMLSNEDRDVLGIPKYKNTKLKKGNYLFGLNFARPNILLKQNVFVVEGYFDQISMFGAGITNTVAVCGTAFSKNHLVKLSRYTDKITFFLDGDEGGRKSTSQIFNRFVNKGIKLRFVSLPENYKDAGEFFLNSRKTYDDFKKEVKYIIPMEW